MARTGRGVIDIFAVSGARDVACEEIVRIVFRSDARWARGLSRSERGSHIVVSRVCSRECPLLPKPRKFIDLDTVIRHYLRIIQ